MKTIESVDRGVSNRNHAMEAPAKAVATTTSESGVTAQTIASAIERHLVRMIPLGEIVLSRRAANLKDQKGPFNPRTERGFDKLSMEDLENSIAQDGLFEYPNVRPIEKGGKTTYQLLAGERRIRAIQSLVEKKAKVYDEATDSMMSAADLYSTVPCRVVKNASDMKALRIAIRENDTHIPPSEKDVVETVEWMLDQEVDGEGRKMSRKEVAQELGKSESWLCQTLAFKAKLDQETLQKLWDGKISRSFAIDLMGYEEADRPVVRQAAEKVATERYENNHERAEAEVAAAELELEEAKELVQEATTPKKAKQAEGKVQRAAKKAKKAEDKLRQIESQGVQVQQSDLTIGALEIGVTPQGNKGLTVKQTQDRWISKIEGYLNQEKVRDAATSRVFPKRDLMLMKVVAEAMAEGGKEPLDVLKAFYGTQGGWGIYGANDFSAQLDKVATGLQESSPTLDDDDYDEEEEDEEDEDGEDNEFDGLDGELDDLDLDLDEEIGEVGDFGLDDDGDEDDDED